LEDRPFWLGVKGLKKFFGVIPTTLICPGDIYTNDVLLEVVKSPLLFVSSYYLSIKTAKQLCWAQHICAPYLNEADAKWFKSALPVVGYFHDFDISINGLDWFTDCLNNWEAAGAKYFVDFREVAGRLDRMMGIQKTERGCELNISGANAIRQRELSRIGFHSPDSNTTEILFADEQGIETIIPVVKTKSGNDEIILSL
jgi:hypothetical protein